MCKYNALSRTKEQECIFVNPCFRHLEFMQAMIDTSGIVEMSNIPSGVYFKSNIMPRIKLRVYKVHLAWYLLKKISGYVVHPM